MRQYLDLVQYVLDRGTRKPNRTGVDTISMFNHNYEIDLREGFPLLTTKKIKWEHIVLENLWFLSGDTNIGFLRHYGVRFWDAWADVDGNVPSAYGNFWRHFPVHGPHSLALSHPHFGGYVEAAHNDQVTWAIDTLRRDPMSRRVVISAWAPGNAQTSKLPPCHALFALNVQNEEDGDTREWVNARLNLHLTQRSCDVALGVPYNIAGYAFLLELFSRFTGIAPGIFAHTLVDAHVYTAKTDGSMAEYDHVPGLRKQLTREPRALPHLIIDSSIRTLADVERIIRERPPLGQILELFQLGDYDPHPAIAFKVAV